MNEEKKLSVPQLGQNTDFSCGAVALRAVFDYFGIKKTEKQMIRLLKTNSDHGTHTENLIRVARKHGFKTKAGHNLDIHDLKKWLDEKKPVIVVLQAKGTEKEYKNLENGHYMVLLGYDKKNLLFSDPLGKEKKIGQGEFLHRWKDYDGGRGMRYRWGLAIWK